jgi:hypothetical protein
MSAAELCESFAPGAFQRSLKADIRVLAWASALQALGFIAMAALVVLMPVAVGLVAAAFLWIGIIQVVIAYRLLRLRSRIAA